MHAWRMREPRRPARCRLNVQRGTKGARASNSGTRLWTSMTESWSFLPDRRHHRGTGVMGSKRGVAGNQPLEKTGVAADILCKSRFEY